MKLIRCSAQQPQLDDVLDALEVRRRASRDGIPPKQSLDAVKDFLRWPVLE